MDANLYRRHLALASAIKRTPQEDEGETGGKDDEELAQCWVGCYNANLLQCWHTSEQLEADAKSETSAMRK